MYITPLALQHIYKSRFSSYLLNSPPPHCVQTNAQLRADLDKSQAAGEEAKKLQAQQNAEIEKLKEDLTRETANVETERNAKWEASKER